MPDETKLNQFALLEKERRQLEDRLEEVKREAKELEQELLPQFAAEGKQNSRTPHGLVYLHRSTYANFVNGLDGETQEALIDTGLDWLVQEKVDQKALAAALRERFTADDELRTLVLPEELQDMVRVTDVFRLRVRTR